jgi:hypothetical protein
MPLPSRRSGTSGELADSGGELICRCLLGSSTIESRLGGGGDWGWWRALEEVDVDVCEERRILDDVVGDSGGRGRGLGLFSRNRSESSLCRLFCSDTDAAASVLFPPPKPTSAQPSSICRFKPHRKARPNTPQLRTRLSTQKRCGRCAGGEEIASRRWIPSIPE